MQGDSQGGTFLQSDNWQETGNPKKKKKKKKNQTKPKEQNDLHTKRIKGETLPYYPIIYKENRTEYLNV